MTWARPTCLLISILALACSDDGPGSDEVGETQATESGDGDGDSGDGDGDSGDGDGDPTTGDGDGDPTTGDGDGDPTGDGDGDPADCGPLSDGDGPVVMVGPEDAAALPGMVYDAAPGTTFVFADGTYDMSASLLHVTTPNLTFRSESYDRDSVILDGDHAIGEIFLVSASDVRIAHLTLSRAYYHAIHVTGGTDENTENIEVHDVAVIDPREQGIKVNPSPEGHYSDNGKITCSHIELTDAGRPIVENNCYTGGIDAHAARGWVVRDNYIEGFWCDEGLSEHAIHFWVTGRDTLVERNTIVDCARGVGFGLGESGNGNTRDYGDDPCPQANGGYLGHIDGKIVNNMIFAARPELFDSQYGFDSGIALEQACGAEAVHNTIVALEQPFVSIEYRWPNTDAAIVNNLVSHDIVMRDGASAEVEGNLTGQGLEHFVDGQGGDLHLGAGSAAIDAGGPGWADFDFDKDPRDSVPDVGADERVR